MISNEEEDANGSREHRLRAATNEITTINLKAFLAACALIDRTMRDETRRLHEKFPDACVVFVICADQTFARVNGSPVYRDGDSIDAEVWQILHWLAVQVEREGAHKPLAFTVLPEQPLQSVGAVDWQDDMCDPTSYALGMNADADSPVFVTEIDKVAWRAVTFSNDLDEWKIRQLVRSDRLRGRP